MSRKEDLKELFNFSAGERKGLTVLAIIIAVLLIIYAYAKFAKTEYIEDDAQFKKEVAEFIKNLKPLEQEKYNSRLDKYIEKRYDTLQLFEFDPNNTTSEEWKLLGLSDKQISTINRYLKNGGRFYEPDDFQKLYGLRQRQFEILEPYINIENQSQNSYFSNDKYPEKKTKLNKSDSSLYFNPNNSTKQNWLNLGFSEKQSEVILNYIKKQGKISNVTQLKDVFCISPEKYEQIKTFIQIQQISENKTEKNEIYVDINILTEQQFIELGGFWKYNAAKIIKYRQILGGFYKKEQLLEVYGVKKEYYDKVEKIIIVSPENIKQININTAEKKELSAHPYFRDNIANDIIEYRNKNGSYKSVQELRDKKIISQTLLEKAKIYLTVK